MAHDIVVTQKNEKFNGSCSCGVNLGKHGSLTELRKEHQKHVVREATKK